MQRERSALVVSNAHRQHIADLEIGVVALAVGTTDSESAICDKLALANRTPWAIAPTAEPTEGTRRSAGGNRLPAGVALAYVRVVAGRLGAVIPRLRIRLTIVVAVIRVTVIRVTVIRAKAKETAAEPAVVKPVRVKSAESAAMEPATAVKPTESAAVEPATAMETTTAMETSATAMHLSVGGSWLAERSNTQQSSQNLSDPGPGSIFA